MRTGNSNAAIKWVLPLVAISLVLILAIWLLMPEANESDPVVGPTTPSTEWTTAPEGPGVEVNLPETPMRNVPAEKESPAPAPTEER